MGCWHYCLYNTVFCGIAQIKFHNSVQQGHVMVKLCDTIIRCAFETGEQLATNTSLYLQSKDIYRLSLKTRPTICRPRPASLPTLLSTWHCSQGGLIIFYLTLCHSLTLTLIPQAVPTANLSASTRMSQSEALLTAELIVVDLECQRVSTRMSTWMSQWGR